jgi:predicted nucleotidyltransferase
MKHIQEFINLSTNNLTETEKILKESNLVIHDSISKIAIMGSRGLLGDYRPDSDIDLAFILDSDLKPSEDLCRTVNELSLSKWAGNIELDTAIVFDKMGCGLLCYERQEYDPQLCKHGKDCIGLFKIQKGFTGFVPDIGLEVKNIYPVLIIWEAR